VAVLDTLETLAPIREKVEAGERLDFEDGLTLMESDDLLALGELADLARRLRGGGDEVYFVQNLYLNQTNVCRVKCKFCAFAKTRKQEDAYTLTGDELVEDAVAQYERSRFTELHSGLRAYTRQCLLSLPFEDYADDFLFDSQLLIDAVTLGYSVVEVPIPTRYTKESSSISVAASLRYVVGSLAYCARQVAARGRKRQRRALHAYQISDAEASRSAAPPESVR